ncbi:hypothetical protein GCM10009124_21480 [Shewanella xiamenensis]|nr:hypothetical protein GCM10009124_21480 [Shewanella xiamenensis]
MAQGVQQKGSNLTYFMDDAGTAQERASLVKGTPRNRDVLEYREISRIEQG